MKVVKLIGQSFALSSLVYLPLVANGDVIDIGGTNTWTLNSGASGNFSIEDGGNVSLLIEAATPSNSLYLSNSGSLGLGDEAPQDVNDFNPRLYIGDNTPEIELDDIDDPRRWQIFADGGDVSQGGTDTLGGIGFADITAESLPFFIQSAAPSASLLIDTNGNVGMGVGLSDLEYNLQVRGEGVGDIAPFDTERVLKLESSLAPEQIFVNTTSGAIWYFAMVSNDDFKVSFDGTGKVEARFKPDGTLRIAGPLIQNSDRDSKMNIRKVDEQDVLERVAALPISTWEYKATAGVRHLGPMAQDFHSAFGLGDSPTGISSIDTGGVALAAVKGLKQEKDDQIEQLKAESDALAAKNARLEAQLEAQAERMVQLELALTEVLRNQSENLRLGSAN